MNTCSSTGCMSADPIDAHANQHQHLRYLEPDLARLKRPVVVSFRKIPNDTSAVGQTERQRKPTGCNLRQEIFHLNELHTAKRSVKSIHISVPSRRHFCLRRLTKCTQNCWNRKALKVDRDLGDLSTPNCIRRGNSFTQTSFARPSWLPVECIKADIQTQTMYQDHIPDYIYNNYSRNGNISKTTRNVTTNVTIENISTSSQKCEHDKWKTQSSNCKQTACTSPTENIRKHPEAKFSATQQLSKPERKLHQIVDDMSFDDSIKSTNGNVKARHLKNTVPAQQSKALLRKSHSFPAIHVSYGQ